ncbi:MAG TPA: bifunctional UDP-N-acetylmuramoyl-tripeptide:D-alanyl-D-alanine ligase/alanine racemase [Cyclobacteriaceae bacterium]|nr:bifunctional UDP-N-acetylmuramoyl-tripeptide:D-alanyl-D-alanine ligase/alanine racemase [Cyclobacteriaceae bacterium]
MIWQINFSDLQEITHGRILQFIVERPVIELFTDSRKVIPMGTELFFAIPGARNDGHDFIRELYDTGVRQFVVQKTVDLGGYPEANFIQVSDTIDALQKISGHHRNQFQIPVIGITGSNGKTIIKEWLFQLLSGEYTIIKNPGSYNSQIGVPLSVWGIRHYHQLGIFEAGISTTGEMEKLEPIIQPTIGLFTNIGSAHDEGFKDIEVKIAEKLKLFRNSKILIYCKDHLDIRRQVRELDLPAFSWGLSDGADVSIRTLEDSYEVTTANENFTISLPFSDKASAENCFHCIATMLYLKYDPALIKKRIQSLRSVPMRLEMKEGINNCQIIDDSYNNDLAGLQISLDFLKSQYQKKKKSIILSDMQQTGLNDFEMAKKVADAANRSGLQSIICIGAGLFDHQNLFSAKSLFYRSTDDFLKSFNDDYFRDEIILIKGARSFHFEKIVNVLQRKVHGTLMEINLGSLIDNLNFFRSKLSGTKIMVMVKAFAYGSGSIEIANVLQYHRVDYLGVAYVDEGVDLRKNNITLPIMVMNPSEGSYDQLLQYGLEPEVYNFRMMKSFLNFLEKRTCRVHIKLDTGMHRLGFSDADLDDLIVALKENKNMEIASIFSHLAGADEERHDSFSRAQGEKFKSWANKISSSLGYRPLYHVLNSPGILRFPEMHFDMVRLGIGLYGIDPTPMKSSLRPVATLKTIISQIKYIPKGETIGYGRAGLATRDLKVATIAIGYADGFSRAFSGGKGEVLINGKRSPVIGNVCMDMTMVDVTDVEAKEGDEVIIFGEQLPIQEVAEKIGTIPYEILTSTSERVKRVFVAESI